MEHLTAHFWLTDDGATLCKGCGATYKASASEVIAFRMSGIRLFMERHRGCGKSGQAQAPAAQKVQIPYKVIPNKPGGSS